jgi:hypothetical protein
MLGKTPIPTHCYWRNTECRPLAGVVKELLQVYDIEPALCVVKW